MAANLDVYELIDRQTFHGQEVLNVYFYQRNSVVGFTDAEDLVDGYLTTVMPTVRAAQNAEVVHTEVSARNLFDVSDRHDRAISLAGTLSLVAADTMSNFNAIGFSLIGNNGAVRNGSKRYAGIDEGVQQDGVITDSSFITTTLGNLGDALVEPFPVGVTDTFFPVIVKRLLSGSAYVLPTSLEEAVVSGIIEAIASTLITSQTSRKQGVGV